MIINSVNPKEGKVGDEVVITGSALNSGPAKSAGSGSVTFNGVSAIPSEWLHNKIVVTVPVGAVSGPLCVAFSGDAAEIPFEVYTESGEERQERLDKLHAGEDKKAAEDKKTAAMEEKKAAEEKKASEDKK